MVHSYLAERIVRGPSTPRHASVRSAQDDGFFIESLSRQEDGDGSFDSAQDRRRPPLQAELIVDSVRSRSPSPCGIACGDSILTIPYDQDSTSSG